MPRIASILVAAGLLHALPVAAAPKKAPTAPPPAPAVVEAPTPPSAPDAPPSSSPMPSPDAPAEAGASPRSIRKVLRIAVYDLAVEGIDPLVAKVFTESLMAELRKLERTTVLGLDEIRAMMNLEAERQIMGCDADASCLAEIADALGADVLLIGSLARVGDTHVIALKGVLQQEARAASTYNRVLQAGNGEEFLAEVGPAVQALFPDTPLRAGATRGVSTEVARRLSPPPIPPWAFWTGVGTSSALLVGAGGAAVLQVLSYNDYKSSASTARNEPVSGALLVQTGQRALLAEQVGWGLLAGAAVIGVASAIVIPLVDFDNIAAEGVR